MNLRARIGLGVLVVIALLLTAAASGGIDQFPNNYFTQLKIGTTSGNPGFINFYGGGANAGVYTKLAADSSGAFLTTTNPIQCPSVTETGLSGAQTDYAPTNGTTACIWRLSSTGNITITGITGGWAGRELWLLNVGSNTISLLTSSDADGNDFLNTGVGNISIIANRAVWLKYDGTASAWKLAAYTTVASVPQGGTGVQTITGLIKGNGTSAFSAATAADIPATTLTTGTSVSLTAPRQYYVCTGTCTVTPPVPAAGYEFCVMNGDNVATVITLAALGSSARYETTARTGYGTAGTGTLVSSGAAADKVCILGLDSTHYLTVSSSGTWTAN